MKKGTCHGKSVSERGSEVGGNVRNTQTILQVVASLYHIIVLSFL